MNICAQVTMPLCNHCHVSIISNLGINPVSGGRPPNDSSIIEQVVIHLLDGAFLAHNS